MYTSISCLFLILLGFSIDQTFAAREYTSVASPCSTLSYLLPDKVFYPTSNATFNTNITSPLSTNSTLTTSTLTTNSTTSSNTTIPSNSTTSSISPYSSSLASYFWQTEQQIHPSCIVTPTSTDDVSIILKALSSIYAQDPKKWGEKGLFAVRSGGHSTVDGAANLEGGVTLDLRGLSGIEIGGANGTGNGDFNGGNGLEMVRVGTGATWDKVYAKLDPLGVGVLGGRVRGIGVGGFLMGGGISFFSPAHGWGCDQILAYTLVLASGQILNVTATSHPDLFSALQGGSNNFGVITHFTLKTFPQGQMWGGSVYTLVQNGTVDQQLLAFNNFMQEENFDDKATVLNSYAWTKSIGFIIVNNLEYSEPVVDPPVFGEFMVSEPKLVNTERVGSLSEFVEEMAGNQPVDERGLYTNTVFTPTLPLLHSIHDLWNLTIATLSEIEGLVYSLTLQRLPSTQPNSTNSFNLPPNAHLLTLLQTSLSWNNVEDDELINSAQKKFIEDVEVLTKEAGVFNEYKYLNYAGDWQDPLGGYGTDSLGRLRGVSRKYDSVGVFQGGVPGGFKLFEVGGGEKGVLSRWRGMGGKWW